MSVTTLTCPCGMTLKAAGARPGRVGKCPRCGGLLKVPDDFAEPSPAPPPPSVAPGPTPKVEGEPGGGGYGFAPESEGRPTFHGSPRLAPIAPRSKPKAGLPVDYGPVRPPNELETRFRQSLGYPLWGWPSIVLLIFLPPILMIVSTPVMGYAHEVFFGTAGPNVGSLLILIPGALMGICVWGYTLVYLGHVLTSSASGDCVPPRQPNLYEDNIFRVLRRWFWALLTGVGLGFAPATLYWIYCGEIDWADRLIFVNLAGFGAAYAQMALLACLLHDDPLAANPITVIGAIVRVGWDYTGVCFLSGLFLVVMIFLGAELVRLGDGFPGVIEGWIFWGLFLYGAMVVLRRLGLFCHRHKVVLAWFPERPTWGR
jgi:hypothetical protein